jgi:hypothetical protein
MLATVAFSLVAAAGCDRSAGADETPRTEKLPDVTLRAGPFVATGEHSRTCRRAVEPDTEPHCAHTYHATVRFRGAVLDDGYFAREIGYDPPQVAELSQLLLFPIKGTLLAVLSPADIGDWLLVEFVEREGAPHLRIHAGCLTNAKGNIFPEGVRRGKACENRPDPRYPNNNWYSRAGRFSFHGAYWLDYRSEQVHLVTGKPPNHFVQTVVGPTADRSAALVVYNFWGDRSQFQLCAVGAFRRKPAQYTGFTRDMSVAPLDDREATITTPPLPSFSFETHDLDALPTYARWRSWLAARFDLETPDSNGRPRKTSVSPPPADE